MNTAYDDHKTYLTAAWIDTPIAPMLAISDDQGLYLLEFTGRKGLNGAIEKLRIRNKGSIALGTSGPIKQIREELAAYFAGTLKTFKTPLHIFGTPFQRTVWEELTRIPYGQTRSYLAQAEAMGRKEAVRAVANANGANQFGIVIPCHRIISSGGSLGGYGGGVSRKQWLLDHEQKVVNHK